MDLDEKRTLALMSLLAGNTRAEAAEIAGVTETSIYNWLAEPGFAIALKKAREAVFADALDGLKAASLIALETLCQIAKNSSASPSARVAASTAILSNCFRAVETIEIQSRLEKLQLQVASLELQKDKEKDFIC